MIGEERSWKIHLPGPVSHKNGSKVTDFKSFAYTFFETNFRNKFSFLIQIDIRYPFFTTLGAGKYRIANQKKDNTEEIAEQNFGMSKFFLFTVFTISKEQ